MPPPPKPAISPAAYTPGSGEPPGVSTRPSRSVSSPPRVLRVSTCSRTATNCPPEPARPSPGHWGRAGDEAEPPGAAGRREAAGGGSGHHLRVLAQPGAYLLVTGLDGAQQRVGLDQMFA